MIVLQKGVQCFLPAVFIIILPQGPKFLVILTGHLKWGFIIRKGKIFSFLFYILLCLILAGTFICLSNSCSLSVFLVTSLGKYKQTYLLLIMLGRDWFSSVLLLSE